MFASAKKRSVRLMATALVLICLAACGPADQPQAGATASAAKAPTAAPTSTEAPVTVPAPTAKLLLTTSESSVEFGSPATFAVELTAGNKPISDAVVQVWVGSATQQVTTDAAGKASASIEAADLRDGTNTVTAEFAGDDPIESTSATATVTVTPAQVQLALASTANPAGSTTVSATLTTKPGGAAGTVIFDVDGAAMDPVAVVDNAATVEITATLGLGDHLVTGTFVPENSAQYAGGVASTTVSVTKIATTVVATAAKESVRYGDQSTFSITVQSAVGGDLTSAVSISDGSTVIVEGTTDAAGLASLPFLNRADPGQQTYTVNFVGSEAVGASSSQFVLNTAQTNVDISITKPSISPNSDGTIVVSLIGTPDKPTGLVTITFDGTEIASGPVDAEGVISAPVTAVPVGSHDIAVAYAGDARFEANTASSTLSIKPPLNNPNADGAAAIEANNPCPVTAAACVDLTNELAWLQSGGKITYGPVSMTSGRAGHRTGVGTFNVYWLDKHHKSSIFNDAPMPNSVFFVGGIAFHAGSLSVQSHGCIHLSNAASEVFFDNLVLGDEVVVFGTEPY